MGKSGGEGGGALQGRSPARARGHPRQLHDRQRDGDSRQAKRPHAPGEVSGVSAIQQVRHGDRDRGLRERSLDGAEAPGGRFNLWLADWYLHTAPAGPPGRGRVVADLYPDRRCHLHRPLLYGCWHPHRCAGAGVLEGLAELRRCTCDDCLLDGGYDVLRGALSDQPGALPAPAHRQARAGAAHAARDQRAGVPAAPCEGSLCQQGYALLELLPADLPAVRCWYGRLYAGPRFHYGRRQARFRPRGGLPLLWYLHPDLPEHV
mmetsp:Transcript_13730/g.32565  ORF Transcript_13730/g.32565 Transcript_13730/m.32565 type:complete len:262 (-) Transcript_13730:248-1033(-)